MDLSELRTLLRQGVGALRLTLPPAAEERLLAYVDLLGAWNRAYNLTAIREPAAMVTHHLLDSLAITSWVHGPRVLDVGSGAGLPGIPLALARPSLQLTLLDANGKKARFLTQAKLELGLQNVTVCHARSEAVKFEPPFDTVVARAVATLAQLIAHADRHVAPQGIVLAMKGRYPQHELAALPAAWTATRIEALTVPGLAAARHGVVLQRHAAE